MQPLLFALIVIDGLAALVSMAIGTSAIHEILTAVMILTGAVLLGALAVIRSVARLQSTLVDELRSRDNRPL